MNQANVAVTVVALAVAALVLHSMTISMTAAAESAVETCDAEHGEDEWVWVTANGSEWDWTYIGDQRVCVDKDSQRAANKT